MSRGVTAAMQAAAEAVPAYPILLWEGLFDSGALRLWSGYGDLAWDAKTWTGAGDLIGVDPAAEVTRIVAAGGTFRLNGIPADLLGLALDEDYQGRPCTLYFGMLDAMAGAVVADPIPVFSGRMDVMELDDGGETASIVLSAENLLADLGRAPGMTYTDENQKSLYPDDEGLAFIAAIQDREIIWR